MTPNTAAHDFLIECGLTDDEADRALALALRDAADEVERLRKAVWASEEIDRRAGMLAGVQAERDASRTAHAALVAELRALHRPRTTAPWLGACTTCLIELGAGGALEAIPAAYPCATAIVLDRHAPEEGR